jgi:hypothetical protein
MKKLILLLVVVLNLSCSKDSIRKGDGLLYFQFLPQDTDKFINSSEVGKILIYKNQNNTELKFKILKNKIEKQLYSRGTFVVGSYDSFHYDEQRIQLGDITDEPTQYYGDYSFFISIKRFPKVFQLNPTVISSQSILITNIGLRLFDNSETAFFDYTEPIISLTINSTVYTKVRRVTLTTNLYPNTNSILKGLTNIYFDQNKGVIGFDDIQNNEWRLQN